MIAFKKNRTKQMREGAVERCGIRDMDGEESYGEKEWCLESR